MQAPVYIYQQIRQQTSTKCYEVLLKKNIEKECMKAPTNVASEISNQTKSIVENLNLTDKVKE